MRSSRMVILPKDVLVWGYDNSTRVRDMAKSLEYSMTLVACYDGGQTEQQQREWRDDVHYKVYEKWCG